MRAYFLFLFVFFASCAEVPIQRLPSSESLIRSGEISFRKSEIKNFPPAFEDGSIKYYFYLQLKNMNGEFVDCDSSEITLKNKKGTKVEFLFERLFPGRYYLILEENRVDDSNEILVFIRGKQLGNNFKLALNYPDEAFTKIHLVKDEAGILTLRLHLNDKNNRPVSSQFPPEMILEGWGEMSDLIPIQEGIWEFNVLHPEVNQIFYISLRSQGVYIPRIYRFQYIEK